LSSSLVAAWRSGFERLPGEIPAAITREDFGRFCGSARFALRERIGHRHTFAWWPQLIAAEALSPEAVGIVQQQRLQFLVEHLAAHVPFYRTWAKESGWKSGDQVRIEDLPIVTKADHRRDPEAFQSEAFPVAEMLRTRTSGSSGEPFHLRTHRLWSDLSYGVYWRGLRRHGIAPRDRRVDIWGRSAMFSDTGLRFRIRMLRNRMRDRLGSVLSLNAYDFAGPQLPQLAEQIRAQRPVWLHGYVSALYAYARYVLERGEGPSPLPGLRLIVCESEKLHDFQRRTMEEAFGCRVIEHYGSVGFGNIAQEDPDGHLRICEDVTIVERDQSGEAIVSNLAAIGYPMLRFRLGDLVEFAEGVPPGLPFRALSRIVGRTVELMPRPSGGMVHGVAVAHVIDPHMSVVRRYRVRQRVIDRLDVELEPVEAGANIPPEVCAKITSGMKALFGAEMHVNIETAQDLKPAVSGKFQWIVSEVEVPGEPVP